MLIQKISGAYAYKKLTIVHDAARKGIQALKKRTDDTIQIAETLDLDAAELIERIKLEFRELIQAAENRERVLCEQVAIHRQQKMWAMEEQVNELQKAKECLTIVADDLCKFKTDKNFVSILIF